MPPPLGAAPTAPCRLSRRERRFLAWVSAGAALLRLLLLLLPRVIRWDEPAYLLLGRALWSGRGYTMTGLPEVHYPPLAPLLFGASWRLLGDPQRATELWFVLFGALLPLPVYRLARRAFGRRTARLAALLTAVYPALSLAVLYWGTMTEPLFLLLLYTALATAAAAAAGERAAPLAAVGLALGLAYLLRPEGSLWLLSTAAALVASRALDRRWARAATGRQTAALVAGFLLVASPYLLYLHRATGRWLLSGKLGITYEIGDAVLADDAARYDAITSQVDPASGEIRWLSDARFAGGGMLHRLLHQPGEVALRVAHNLARLAARALRQPVVPFPLLPFVLLGAVGRPWRRRRLAGQLWLAAGALPVASFLFFHIEQRFFAPAFPALLVWTAAGLRAALARLARGRRSGSRPPGSTRRRLGRYRAAALLAVAATLAVAALAIYRRERATLRTAHREVGSWIGRNTPAGARVVAVELAVCAYADRPCLPSPRARYPELLAYARRHGAAYLVVDEQETRAARPFLLPLLEAERPPAGVSAVFQTSDGSGRTVVFRVDKNGAPADLAPPVDTPGAPALCSLP